MAAEWLEIEQLATKVNKGVSTVRRHLKDLSKDKKDLYIKKIQTDSNKGGIKHLYHNSLITLLFSSDRDDKDDKDVIETHEPEYTKRQEHLTDNDNSIIEILRGQIEYLQKQGEVKDGQISNLSEANKELLERLKEVNYSLGNAQKQLSKPIDDKDVPLRWWQFWK